jgi:catechol 2,3-dioxygenase-like lactoylglutathione lyase family enzyme
MIDHTGLVVSDFEKSKIFYMQALAPIGYELLADFPACVTSGLGEEAQTNHRFMSLSG